MFCLNLRLCLSYKFYKILLLKVWAMDQDHAAPASLLTWLEMETLGPYPRLTEFRIGILTRCSGLCEKHWCKEQICHADAAIDTRQIIYCLFSICFYWPPGNQEAVCVGLEMREMEKKCYDRNRNGWETEESKRGLEILGWERHISTVLL